MGAIKNIKKGFLTFSIPFLVLLFSAYTIASTNSDVLASARAKGKLVADYWVNSSGKSPTSDYYADACSFYGSIRFGEANKDSSYYKKIYNTYKNRTSPIPTGDVDKNSAGLLPLYLFTKSRDSAMLKLGKAAADASVNAGGYKRDAIDDTYMTGSLMIQAYRATGDTKYLDFCADYIIYYQGKLLQDSNGLYWHRIGSKLFWSRGNGWGASSTTELLLELPKTHAKYAGVLAGFQKHMNGLLKAQRTSGLWMQLLDSDASNNWVETSGSSMFLFAMFTGMEKGWLDSATFLEPAKKGWNALLGYLGNDGKLKNICTGFWGDGTAASYLNAAHNEAGNAHGTCGFLWASTAIINFFTAQVATREWIAVERNTVHYSSIHGANVSFDLMGRIVPFTAGPGAQRFSPSGLLLKKDVSRNGTYIVIR
jgi:unsaturated rhamnogalacturonyl hydrolase